MRGDTHAACILPKQKGVYMVRHRHAPPCKTRHTHTLRILTGRGAAAGGGRSTVEKAYLAKASLAARSPPAACGLSATHGVNIPTEGHSVYTVYTYGCIHCVPGLACDTQCINIHPPPPCETYTLYTYGAAHREGRSVHAHPYPCTTPPTSAHTQCAMMYGDPLRIII